MKNLKIIFLALALTSQSAAHAMNATSNNTDVQPEQSTLVARLLTNLNEQLRGCVNKMLPSWLVGQDCREDFGSIQQAINNLTDHNAQACLKTFQYDTKLLESFVAQNQQETTQLMVDLIQHTEKKLADCLQNGTVTMQDLSTNYTKVLLDSGLTAEMQNVLHPQTLSSEVKNLATSNLLPCMENNDPNYGWPQAETLYFDPTWPNTSQCPANYTIVEPLDWNEVAQDYFTIATQWCQENPEVSIAAAAVTLTTLLVASYKLTRYCCKKAPPAPIALSPLAQWAEDLDQQLTGVLNAGIGTLDITKFATTLINQKDAIKAGMDALKETAPHAYRTMKAQAKTLATSMKDEGESINKINAFPINVNYKTELVKSAVERIKAQLCWLIKSFDPHMKKEIADPRNKHLCTRLAYKTLGWMQWISLVGVGVLIGTYGVSK